MSEAESKKGSTTFLYYSFFNNWVNRLLDALIPPLRMWAFKLLLGSCGARTMIDYGCYFRYFKKIDIGSGVTINRGFRVFPSYQVKSARIQIGNDVMIAPGVTLLGAGHDPHDGSLSDVGDAIEIRAKAFIGANSTIRYGVTIGEGAVVAAGAVVVNDVPAGVIVGGVPARPIS